MTITFNNFSELVSTLESINGLSRHESIVINGGTCQQTLDYLKRRSSFSLTEKDEGISDAFNKGIIHSHGEAILFLNSGDRLIDHEYINWADEQFSLNPKLDYTYSDIIFRDPNSKRQKVISAKNAQHRSLARGIRPWHL